jgi:pyruvate, orthophosphate dikinase
MFRLGLPVPLGFVVSTEACKEYYKQSDLTQLDEHIWVEIERSVKELARQTNKYFGCQDLKGPMDPSPYATPLLLSIRSGAALSMPGMMDTILNLGINENSIHIMARMSNNLKWAYDTYRRFLYMFGTVVLGISKERYETILEDIRNRHGFQHDSQFRESDLIHITNLFKSFTPVPDDPWQQLRIAVRAVLLSWNTPRAKKYRDIHNISQELGTAIVVQSMVYGNMNNKSGSGVAFTRNPVTGEKVLYGEYLPNAEGEDVVAGIRTPLKLLDLASDQPSVYDTLVHIEKLLERHYRNMQVIFTLNIWILGVSLPILL